MDRSPLTLRIGRYRLFGHLAFIFLLLCSILLGAAAGLLFVYGIDLPQVEALETYRPDVMTELYADDGTPIASFALERRILVTYDEIPPVLRNAILATEDRHFEEHWGVDFPRVLKAAWRNLRERREAEGASTLTMQLARMLFLTPEKSFRRKIQETLLALQIERRYSKPQIFTMYCNQIYLGHGNYGVAAAAQFYFGKRLNELTLPEAALLAALIRSPQYYSPINHPDRALARRNLVLDLMAESGKISRREAAQARAAPLGLHLQMPREDLAPYFAEEVRQWLEERYGPEATTRQGLRVYTTLNVAMQQAANRAVSDGLHAYERRHGWRGGLTNILQAHLGSLETYRADDWDRNPQPGDYCTALVLSVRPALVELRIGNYRATLTPPDFAWTGFDRADRFLQPGDLVEVRVVSVSGEHLRVSLEQHPQAQAALVAIENATGEIKALVGGYSFEESKFDRATQAYRQAGSSFKIYLYSAAIERGWSPFDTIQDAPFSVLSGGHWYSPHNYDGHYEGRITLRRALAASRNVAAVRLAALVGLDNVIAMARRFGITAPLPRYMPLVLGAADVTLLEHTSAFTVFPNEGVRVEPHFVRRVATYDGAVLYQARPRVYDVLSPAVAHTMTAMLEDVVNFGTGVRARALGRPCGGKTGTTQNWTDAWFIGFTPSLTAGVWVGYDDKRLSLGRGEQGSVAALPIWLQFMREALDNRPVENFAGVTPLEQLAAAHLEQIDTPDTAPAEASESGGGTPSRPPGSGEQRSPEPRKPPVPHGIGSAPPKRVPPAGL
jgi:penicillin-binding protein 1A